VDVVDRSESRVEVEESKRELTFQGNLSAEERLDRQNDTIPNADRWDPPFHSKMMANCNYFYFISYEGFKFAIIFQVTHDILIALGISSGPDKQLESWHQVTIP